LLTAFPDCLHTVPAPVSLLPSRSPPKTSPAGPFFLIYREVLLFLIQVQFALSLMNYAPPPHFLDQPDFSLVTSWLPPHAGAPLRDPFFFPASFGRSSPCLPPALGSCLLFPSPNVTGPKPNSPYQPVFVPWFVLAGVNPPAGQVIPCKITGTRWFFPAAILSPQAEFVAWHDGQEVVLLCGPHRGTCSGFFVHTHGVSGLSVLVFGDISSEFLSVWPSRVFLLVCD